MSHEQVQTHEDKGNHHLTGEIRRRNTPYPTAIPTVSEKDIARGVQEQTKCRTTS